MTKVTESVLKVSQSVLKVTESGRKVTESVLKVTKRTTNFREKSKKYIDFKHSLTLQAKKERNKEEEKKNSAIMAESTTTDTVVVANGVAACPNSPLPTPSKDPNDTVDQLAAPASPSPPTIAQGTKRKCTESAGADDIAADTVAPGAAGPSSTIPNGKATLPVTSVGISNCADPAGCVTLADILKCFNAAVSEEQAWALIYQSVRLYRDALRSGASGGSGKHAPDTRVPTAPRNFNVHKDGSVHVSFQPRGELHLYTYVFILLFLQTLDYLFA